jgi:hypothetical protein
MSIRDRMTSEEQIRSRRIRQATEKGRRIDRLFERACAKCSLDPVAARTASPLLMLELAELEQEQDAYSARLDLARSIDACYAAIRERVAQGGKPWTPPEGGVVRQRLPDAISRETGEPACKSKPSC